MEAESSSSSSDEEVNSVSRTRNQRLRAQRDQLKRRLTESRERALQLELQLAKTQNLLDAANKRLTDHRCFVDGDAGALLADSQPSHAGSCGGKGKAK